MGQELLVNEQIDDGEAFVRDFGDYVPVSAAFWVNPADSDKWYLYIASDDIDDSNFDIAYVEVLRRINRQKYPWLDPFRIKLVNSVDSVARDAIEIRDRYPANIPTQYNRSSLGGLGIDGAYIYPRKSVRQPVS